MGHSMGSFIMRYYISKYKVEKCILMGTGYIGELPATILVLLSKLIGAFKGDKYVSKLLVSLSTGAYAKRIKGDTYDWISYNEENIKAFAEDPLCNYFFSVSAYKYLGKYLLKINKRKTIEDTDKDTEILFVSGSDDPVGNFERGVLKVYNKYKKFGFKNLKIRFFKNMRHEILNEKDNLAVYKFLSDFLAK